MHKLRYRTGPVRLVSLPCPGGDAVEPGDLIWLEFGQARPLAAFPWDTDGATTRQGFAAVFAGVAHSAKAAGVAGEVTLDVAPLAVYHRDCAPDSYPFGQAVGPDDDGVGLLPDRLKNVFDAAEAVGRVASTAPGGSTAARVGFAPAFHPASANVQAAVA